MVIVLFVVCMLVLMVLWMMSLNTTVEDFFADRVEPEPSDPRAVCRYNVFTFPNVDEYGMDEYGTPCSVTLGLVGDSKSRIYGSYYYHNAFGVPAAEFLTEVRPKARMREDDEIDLLPPW